jgi:hypothetical protein
MGEGKKIVCEKGEELSRLLIRMLQIILVRAGW